MKKLLITAAAVLITLNMYSQGTVAFSNIGATDAQKVHMGSMSGPLAPAGSQYNLGLFYAADGTTDESMFVQLGAAAPVFGASGTQTGLFSGGTRTAPTATPGGFGAFQVRAWETALGNSYDTSRAAGGATGKSAIFRVDTSDPTITPAQTPASILQAGFQGFAVVPEPSAIALGILGAGTLLLLRRRK
jgi:hypothetical protein